MHTARRFAGEMLRQRGYACDEALTEVPFAEYKANVHDLGLSDLYAERAGGRPEAAYVRFCNMQSTKKLSPALLDKEVSYVQARLAQGEGEAAKLPLTLVLVCCEAPPSNVDVLLKNDPRYRDVQVFTYDSLQFNPTKHQLVPRHEPVPADDVAAVLELYGCERRYMTRDFPRLPTSDVIAKWLGLRPNTLCKITRTSEQTGRYAYFRVVV